MDAGTSRAGGAQNYGVKEAFDYVNRCQSLFQMVVTAVVSNRELVDGLAVEVQQPDFAEAELEYLVMTRQESYAQMKDLQKRIVELLAYQRKRQAWRKRTEMAVEIVLQIEDEGHFPQANYAFDFRLSCVAQLLVQRAACSGGKSERFEFADEKATVGQKVYTIAREALAGVLRFANSLFAQGRTCDQVLQAIMPA